MGNHTVKVSQETFLAIEGLKIHHRQPADEIIGKAVSLLQAFQEVKKAIPKSIAFKDLPPELREQMQELFEKI